MMFTYHDPRQAARPKCPFLPRDAMRKRGLCCGPVSDRPSVRLSVTFMHAFYPDG